MGIADGMKPPVLLFVATNKRILELKKQMKKARPSLQIESLHYNQSVAEKNEIVTKFREESIWFLICNDELSRGMDFMNVNTVIIYDFPIDSKQYIHRIGRTGRADRVGTAHTLWMDVDTGVLSVATDVMIESGQRENVPQWMLDVGIARMGEKQKKVVKLGTTIRGPIRKGGDHIHGTSVLARERAKRNKWNNTGKNKGKNK